MGDAFDIPQAHGQHRLSTIQRLHLGFLVDAQHQGVVRRIEVEADDIADLFDEEGLIGDLEVALPMRLHAKQIEPALDRALGYAGFLGHRAHAPMRAIGRLGLQRSMDDFGDSFIIMGSGPTAFQVIVQPLDAVIEVTLVPFSDGVLVQTQALGNGGVGFALGAGQNDLCAPDQSMRKRTGIGEAEKLSVIIVAQHDGLTGTTTRHGQKPGWSLLIIVLFTCRTAH